MPPRKRNMNIPVAVIGGVSGISACLPFCSSAGIYPTFFNMFAYDDDYTWVIFIGFLLLIQAGLLITFALLDIQIGLIITSSSNMLSSILVLIFVIVLTTEYSWVHMGPESILHIILAIGAVVMTYVWKIVHPGNNARNNARYYNNYGTAAANYAGGGAAAGSYSASAIIQCIAGSNYGKSMDIANSGQVTIGRDPMACHIAMASEGVSRQHCTVAYDKNSQQYIVTDYSSNGTYAGNYKLPHGVPTMVAKGSILTLGNTNEQIRLN